MIRRFFKVCGAVLLSVALLYSGVAWAVEACLFQNKQLDHAALLNGRQERNDVPLSNDPNSPDHHGATFHCANLQYQIAPMAETSPTGLAQFVDHVSVGGSCYLGLPASSATKDFRLQAFLEKFSSPSSLSGLRRHLFFSVFLI